MHQPIRIAFAETVDRLYPGEGLNVGGTLDERNGGRKLTTHICRSVPSTKDDIKWVKG
jgi:hypothetical protein